MSELLHASLPWQGGQSEKPSCWRKLLLGGCALILLVVASTSLSAQDETPVPPPAEKLFHAWHYPLGNFILKERSGESISPVDLRGKIWVAQFFYPGCTGACTRTTPNMKRLQEMFRGRSDVKLVSIALTADSADTLDQYARSQNAEPGQWLFLTDAVEEKIHDIVQTCFLNEAYRKKNPIPGDEIAHSSRLVLIDPQGLIDGYVEGEDPRAADVMKRQIERLRLEQRIPITGADLPRCNALLNAACTVFLLMGWIAIRLRWETVHKILMLLALATSAIFLASYLYYHFVILQAEPMRFRGEGTIGLVYFAILLTHTVLAIAVAPMALYITVLGLQNALAMHRRVAQWTLPLWLYVSATGVIVYWMLYRLEF